MRLSEVDMQEHGSACECTLSTHRVLLEVHLAGNDVPVESQDLHVHVIKSSSRLHGIVWTSTG